MNRNAFPFNLHWTSDELANAVPLQLHDLVRFDAPETDAANLNGSLRHDWARRGYLQSRQLPTFIRVC